MGGMVMQHQTIRMTKKRFRIGQLARELKVKKFVIRFWEKEFSLQSDRSQGGQRFYTDEDLQTFKTIKDLLYNQGYTIAGAKVQLHKQTEPVRDMVPAIEAPEDIQELVQRQLSRKVEHLMAQLGLLKEQLEKFDQMLDQHEM